MRKLKQGGQRPAKFKRPAQSVRQNGKRKTPAVYRRIWTRRFGFVTTAVLVGGSMITSSAANLNTGKSLFTRSRSQPPQLPHRVGRSSGYRSAESVSKRQSETISTPALFGCRKLRMRLQLSRSRITAAAS